VVCCCLSEQAGAHGVLWTQLSLDEYLVVFVSGA